MTPDPALTYVIGFSGGKDSVASWLHLTRELNLPNVVCTFADTGHESSRYHEQLSQRFEKCPCLDCYLKLLERDHGLPLVRIQPIIEDLRGELIPIKIAERIHHPYAAPDGDSAFCQSFWEEDLWKQPLDMERLAIIKRRFASPTVRFCTTHLKLCPQRRWLHGEFPDRSSVVRVSGVRADESESRAAREQYSFDEFMDCPLWLPIHKWTVDEVFAIHSRFSVPINPLYLHGMGRVGCFPCLMSRKVELGALANRFPEAFEGLATMEEIVAGAADKPALSFFSTGKTPNRYASHICAESGKRFPIAEDVRLWALGEEPSRSGQIPLFEDDWTEDVLQCVSQYGLCE